MAVKCERCGGQIPHGVGHSCPDAVPLPPQAAWADADRLRRELEEVESRRCDLHIGLLRAESRVSALMSALEPLKAIADAYDANALDDEARKTWGANDEHENATPAKEVILYAGRGGRTLLTLWDCLHARATVAGKELRPQQCSVNGCAQEATRSMLLKNGDKVGVCVVHGAGLCVADVEGA